MSENWNSAPLFTDILISMDKGKIFFFAEYKSRYIWGEKEREIFNNFRYFKCY